MVNKIYSHYNIIVTSSIYWFFYLPIAIFPCEDIHSVATERRSREQFSKIAIKKSINQPGGPIFPNQTNPDFASLDLSSKGIQTDHIRTHPIYVINQD